MPSRWASAPACFDARPGDDVEAVLRVIGVVGARVVLERLDAFVTADGSDRTPVEVAEDDDEVRGDALRVAVELLGV